MACVTRLSFPLLAVGLAWVGGCRGPLIQAGPAAMESPAVQIGPTTMPAGGPPLMQLGPATRPFIDLHVTINVQPDAFRWAVSVRAPIDAAPDLGKAPDRMTMWAGIAAVGLVGALVFHIIVHLWRRTKR